MERNLNPAVITVMRVDLICLEAPQAFLAVFYRFDFLVALAAQDFVRKLSHKEAFLQKYRISSICCLHLIINWFLSLINWTQKFGELNSLIALIKIGP